MPNFFFWNLSAKPLQDLVAAAAQECDADLLVFAECNLDRAVLLGKLNAEQTKYFLVSNFCPRITILTKFDPEFLHLIEEGDRYSISRVALPARNDILLVTAHLPSKREFTVESQAHECARLARQISAVEEAVGHQRTLFIGDLNANPFEDGLVSAAALHAVMTKDTAVRGARTVQGQKYPFFYNPMWSHFGDARAGIPSGTFYYEKAEHTVFSGICSIKYYCVPNSLAVSNMST